MAKEGVGGVGGGWMWGRGFTLHVLGPYKILDGWCSKHKVVKLDEMPHSHGLQEKEKWRPCQKDIFHCCVPISGLQCKPSLVVPQSYSQSLCKNRSSGSLKQIKYVFWYFGCRRRLIQHQRDFPSKGLFFSYRLFSMLSRIIVDIITSSSLLPDSSWALESKKNSNFTHQAKKLKFHTLGLFSHLYQLVSSIWHSNLIS